MDTNTMDIIEMTESGVKLIVGYVHKNIVYVLHALESTYSHLNKGQIADKEQMSEAIKEVINSASHSLNRKIQDLVLVIPPLELKIASDEGHTNTVSKDGSVKKFDVSNAISILLKKLDMGKDEKMIDVVPYRYAYDNNVQTRFFKDDIYSNTINISANVYYCEQKYYETMVVAIKDAGFNVSRTLFAPVCLVSLLSSYNIPDKFLFLDFGAGLTTFGLASGGRLVKSQVLNYGSEDLTHALMNKFHLSYDRADYLKKVYGLSDNPDIEFTFEEGFKVQDIKDTLIESLNTLIDFMRKYVLEFDIPEFYPIFLTGGGSNLFGIETYISSAFQIGVSLYTPEFFGARNKAYSNLVAALMHLSIYSENYIKENKKDFTMTRVGEKIDLKKINDDEL